MALSDLPAEIILNIADQLDVAGMNALVRTNRLMYTLLNGYLYRRDLTKSFSRSLNWVIKNGLEATATSNTVQWAIDAGRYLNPIPEGFHFALQRAAGRGYAHLVERLLKVNGININFKGLRENTPPYSCCPEWP